MTPRELFEKLCNGECSRYEVLKAVEQIDSNHISAYLDDIKELRAEFESVQFNKANNGMWEAYYAECNYVDSVRMLHNADLEYPTEPTPFDIPDYPTKPKLYDYLIEQLAHNLNLSKNQDEDILKLPSELDTDRAKKYIARAIERGFISTTPIGLKWHGTKKELALFAELLSEKIGYKGKWKIAQNLFSVDNLAQSKYKAIEEDGKFSNRQDEIIRIFEN